MYEKREGDYRAFCVKKHFLIRDWGHIVFGIYRKEGGTAGEMSMRWSDLGLDSVPYLHCYDDAWNILPEFSDLIAKMAEVNNKNITQDQFIDILLSCGFVDMQGKHKRK